MCSRLAKMTHLITVLSKVAIRYSCSYSLINFHQGKESHLVRLRGIQWGHKTSIRIRSIEWTPVLQTAVVFLGIVKEAGKNCFPREESTRGIFPRASFAHSTIPNWLIPVENFRSLPLLFQIVLKPFCLNTARIGDGRDNFYQFWSWSSSRVFLDQPNRGWFCRKSCFRQPVCEAVRNVRQQNYVVG